MKYTFICEADDGSRRSVEFDGDELDGILVEFELFLKGAGFELEGPVGIEEREPEDDAQAAG